MKKQVLILSIIMICLTFLLKGQSIGFHCTNIDSNGNVLLSWTPVGLSANYQYEIYAATSLSGTPFNLLATISQNSYTHIGANASTQGWFYYIKAVSSNPSEPILYSDTIGSILMGISNSGMGIITLYWTKPIANNNIVYEVFRERNGIWNLWGTTTDLFFSDTITVCGENLSYQIQTTDTSGCKTYSMVQSDFLTDFLAPSIPILDTVSINPTNGKTELGWQKSPEKDVFGYIVYIFQNGIWNVVDTVYGAENTHYVDFTTNSETKINQYRICAIDTCRNASPLGDIHHTMLPQTSVNKCDSLVTISWNAYENMPFGVSCYYIFAEENTSGFILVDSVNGNVTSYTHKNVNTSSSYTYYIVACNLDSQYYASSAKVQVQFNRVLGHGNLYLRYVSVINNEDVEISVYVEDTIQFRKIKVYYGDDFSGEYSLLTDQTKTIGKNYLFVDENIDVSSQKRYYFAVLTDECDEIFAYSDTINNIVLQEQASQADKVNLLWNAYNGFSNRLESYTILRTLQMQTQQTLASISPVVLNYEDDVWNLASSNSKFYYQISANEGKNNPLGFQDKSFSNIIEISKEAEVFIPNAFRPESAIAENQIFKPVFSYMNNQDYQFIIYNRWGEVMFSTTDINQGWDGTENGKVAQMGGYIYILTYQNKEGKIVQKRGHVTLLR